MPTFISLGDNCQPAYQIRRLTGDDTAYLFDFLITPIEASQSLLGDAGNWFRPGNWELVDEGWRLVDKGTGLGFMHEFEHLDGSEHVIDTAKVEGHLDEARRKFSHLREKTLGALRSAAEPVLIRREAWVRTEEADAKADFMLAVFGPLNPNLKVVVVSEGGAAEGAAHRRLFLNIKPADAWSGDDASWNRAFALIGAWRDSLVGA